MNTETTHFKKDTLWVVFCVLLFLIVVDLAARQLFWRSEFPVDLIDIQTPEILDIKLEYIRRFDGKKVVLIGDSLVYGRAMEEYGDRAWRDHTLSAQLDDRLRAAYPDSPLLVINLAMNGAVPSDLLMMIRRLLPLQVDLVIADLSLRSFSMDFAGEDAQVTRDWLRVDGGHIVNDPLSQARTHAAASPAMKISRVVSQYWFLYKIRSFLHWRAFNGEPSYWFRGLRSELNRYFLGQKPAGAGGAMEQIGLLLKAKNRYSSVNVTDANPQVLALKQLLAEADGAGQRIILFYATEDPDMINRITDPDLHAQNLDMLEKIIVSQGGGRSTFLSKTKALQPRHFLDYVHLNREGYSVMADRLLLEIQRKAML